MNDFLILFNIFLIFVIFFFNKENLNLDLFKKELIVTVTIFFIVFLNIFASDFSDDLNHYHYSSIVNTDTSNYIWGLSHLHPLYSSSSIWLIGQSYLNFDHSRLQDIHIVNGIILFLFLGIFALELKKKKNDFYVPIILSLFLFVLIKYSRLKEFGIDRPAYLFIFISIFYYFKYFIKNKILEINNHYFILSLILLTAFFIKSIFIFFLLLITVPFFEKKKFNLDNKYFTFFSIILLSYFLKNLLISGCLLFPLSFSCIEQIPWSYSSGLVKLSESAEVFNKSFPSYVGTLSSNEYIKDFNWLNTWFNRHLTEIFEFFLTIAAVFICTLISFKIIKKQKINHFDNKFFFKILKLILVLSFLLFISVNPNIRMNHHIFVLPMILILIYYFYSKKFLLKKNFFITVIILSLCFNSFKNIKRIHENDYENNLQKFVSSKIKKQINYKIGDLDYYVGWYGKGPISENELEDKIFKKFFIFKIIY